MNTTFDTLCLACAHLGITPASCAPAPIPPAPKGYTLRPSFTATSALYNTTSTVPFIAWNTDRILFCHPLHTPHLIKPKIIQAVWLHLHLSILTAIDSGAFTPQAIATNRIQPCIPGIKILPPEIFPHAFSILQDNLRIAGDLDNLPF